MQSLILTLYLIVCFLLIVLILLQSGKEGMGVIFGGGNSSVFGSAGAGGILAKLTTLMAIIFIITALAYTYVSSSRPAAKSVILDVRIEEPTKQDTKPAKEGSGKSAVPAGEISSEKSESDAAAKSREQSSTLEPAEKSASNQGSEAQPAEK